jgi:hypothetical protein
MMEMERSRLLEALRAIAWNISRDAPGWGSPEALGCDWPPRPSSCTGRAGCGPAVDNHPTAAEGAIIAGHRGQPDEGRKQGVRVFRQAALEGDLRRLAPSTVCQHARRGDEDFAPARGRSAWRRLTCHDRMGELRDDEK